jgi:hypothetical protein
MSIEDIRREHVEALQALRREYLEKSNPHVDALTRIGMAVPRADLIYGPASDIPWPDPLPPGSRNDEHMRDQIRQIQG